MGVRILLVEDEETLQASLKLNLEIEGYDVTVAGEGPEALKLFKGGRYDLVVLDVMLPGMDGFDVCETIRLENTVVPILFLTAKNTAQDRVAGLKKGADDYLVKPFNLEEFLLRVDLLIQRGKERASITAKVSGKKKLGNKTIDFSTFEITTESGSTQVLSQREIKLLKLMMDKEGQVVSREEILEKVWGYDVYPSTRTIDNYVVTFRKIFEEDPKHPQHFLSVRGVGYKFVL